MLDNHVGVAHTRWATHGPPSDVNSHPHVSDPSHAFVVVHNGIVTNCDALRASLVRPKAARPPFHLR
jgi:glutamine---fructose-6-phosphate transaminase (isomerizing)